LGTRRGGEGGGNTTPYPLLKGREEDSDPVFGPWKE
jgi:hypothetical protein